MNPQFDIQYKKSNGNLHLRPMGELDGSSAWRLIHLIGDIYDGKGRVFIDTQALQEAHPFGCGILKRQLTNGAVPSNRLFFKGPKGFEMAPDGSKVILASRRRGCGCTGDCANCHCSRKRQSLN